MIIRLLLGLGLSLMLHARSANDTPGWHLYPSYARHLCRLPAAHTQQIFFRADTDKRIVALTFDDGPLGRTPALLKLLKRRQTTATFFLLAPQLTRAKARLYADPLFTVGIHGYRHLDYRKLSPGRIRKEIDRALRIFHRYDLHPCCLRPPYGMTNAILLRELGQRSLRPVLWSLDSQDWNHYRGRKLIHNVVRHLAPGSVILLHDQAIRLQDIDALITAIGEAGYRIEPLSRLVQEKSLLPCSGKQND